MPRLEACLVDAYDTIVTCDFTPLRQGVPVLAGVRVDNLTLPFVGGFVVTDRMLEMFKGRQSPKAPTPK